MKDWNYKDWQGRSKKQVESNYEVLAYTIVVGFVIIVGALVAQSLLGL